MTAVIAEKAPPFTLGKAARFGLISGIVIVYLCLVGMVETFHDRDVIFELLTLGETLLVIASIGMGYALASSSSNGNIGKALTGGLITGVVAWLVTALLVLVSEPIEMREMFVNASPALNEILTFDQESQVTGLLLLAAFIILLHLFGAFVYTLPAIPRRFILAGLMSVLIVGMLQELLEVIMSRSDAVEPLADFLFGKTGLSIPGLITVFVVFAVIDTLWNTQGPKVRKSINTLPPSPRRAVNWVSISIGLIFLMLLPQIVGSYISQILVLVGLFVLMGLGLNIEIGLAGLLDLGFVGFYAVGAYIVALSTTTSELGLSSVLAGEPTGASWIDFWAAVPIAVVVSALFGIILGIPVLRMRGDYLAIVTLGLAEIIRILVLSDFLRPILGGAQGILSIPKPLIGFLEFTVKDPGHFYYLIVIGCFLIAFIAWRLQNARIGRNWMAMREDEDVAEAMGINLVASKLLAFGIGAAFAGLAGAIFAAQVGSIFPHSFQLLISVNVVSLVIIGGVGSIPGVIVGALVLVGLPELLREFAEFRLLIYGALLVAMMLIRPEGLWPSEVTRREMYDDDASQAPAPAAK